MKLAILLTAIIATIISIICIYMKKLLDNVPIIDRLIFGGKWR